VAACASLPPRRAGPPFRVIVWTPRDDGERLFQCHALSPRPHQRLHRSRHPDSCCQAAFRHHPVALCRPVGCCGSSVFPRRSRPVGHYAIIAPSYLAQAAAFLSPLLPTMRASRQYLHLPQWGDSVIVVAGQPVRPTAAAAANSVHVPDRSGRIAERATHSARQTPLQTKQRKS
jgi:hypothetical protein